MMKRAAQVVLVAALVHRILVLNAADQPIFELRVGNATQNAWGPDLLPFNDAIDVSRGRDVKFALDGPCLQDVAATYRDGLVVVLRSIDLCNVTQLKFRR